jgi:vesicle-fusing ATPase
MLHVIIFDEMDAIMKKRGSTRDGTGVADSIVNQLLSKIDGVNSLNNILIIGMTNRLDMIDEAILRPGRLEIHIEITLPNEEGRLQILNIKTSEMRKNKRLSDEVLGNMKALAHRSKNYTGAEIERLVRSAASFAISRNIDPRNIKRDNTNDVKVEFVDFERALDEIVPAFGNKDNSEIKALYSSGIVHHGPAFEDLWMNLLRLVNQTRVSARTPLMSVLLEGALSTGKTALAAKLCSESDFPFVRMISADTMIGMSEATKCMSLLEVFNAAYKSPLSIIFIDDIERILEYTPVGHRFSNTILQTLLILLRKTPPSPCRLLIISTTSISSYLEDLQLTQSFNVLLHVTMLQTVVEIEAVIRQYAGGLSAANIANLARSIHKPIGVKQLLLVLEMARSEELSSISPEHFMECLHTMGF